MPFSFGILVREEIPRTLCSPPSGLGQGASYIEWEPGLDGQEFPNSQILST